MHRELTADKAELCWPGRPGDEVAAIRLQLARNHLADIRALDARMKTVAAQISDLVAGGHHLTDLYGIGPVIAGGSWPRPRRRPVRYQGPFASYNGTAPIDVSSGDQVRHRLSRAGNRRINHALHMMAVTQIRYPAPRAAATTNANEPKARPPRKRCAA